MAKIDELTQQFEEQRTRLRGIAYRMLGSFSEADDAVQEAWLRLSRTDAGEIENLNGWLTAVVTRVCLNLLQARRSRREDSLSAVVPEPTVSVAFYDPEHEAVLADSVGIALQVVLETLSPPERVAFVLHDLFSLPFDEIASIMGKSTIAVRQLASRARRRVQGRPIPDSDLAGQWDVVVAFYAAARDGDLERLLEVLDPDVVRRMEGPVGAAGRRLIRGARAVAQSASAGSRLGHQVRLALVNGAPGAIILERGQPVALMRFTVIRGKIVEIEMLTDPARLRAL
ncbi:MAG TPA: sigma-70 family RNA polymerase sigma factor [Candidatus Dormibacteraeota bacterium]|nr:sigma-70 family RNA polymerase sigma factor [Candidatus Dormibacteraeota bacterium]